MPQRRRISPARSGAGPSSDEVLEVLRQVEDPEAPISIVDLGLVEECRVDSDGAIEVVLVPTRSSCPAREFILSQVERRLREAFSGRMVRCRWLSKAAWSTTRISEAGRAALQSFGIAVPDAGTGAGAEVRCPYCGSLQVRRDARFGASVCRALWYCEACSNPFEEMRWMEACSNPFEEMRWMEGGT